MSIFKKISLLISFLIATSLTTAVAGNSYIVDNENSVVNFSVTKKQYMIDPAVFQDITGTIDAQGNVEISIDINSVDSSNPIRDNRLIDMFFQADFFPNAIITAKLDRQVLDSNEAFQKIELPATLEFFGTSNEITLHILIAKMENNIIVTSLKPIIIDAKKYGVPIDNINALSKVCGGIAISGIVPVNFVLTFNKKI